jgi:hypothetical protein
VERLVGLGPLGRCKIGQEVIAIFSISVVVIAKEVAVVLFFGLLGVTVDSKIGCLLGSLGLIGKTKIFPQLLARLSSVQCLNDLPVGLLFFVGCGRNLGFANAGQIASLERFFELLG